MIKQMHFFSSCKSQSELIYISALDQLSHYGQSIFIIIMSEVQQRDTQHYRLIDLQINQNRFCGVTCP